MAPLKGLHFHIQIHTHTRDLFLENEIPPDLFTQLQSPHSQDSLYLHRMMPAAETTCRVFPFLIPHCTQNERWNRRTVQL